MIGLDCLELETGKVDLENPRHWPDAARSWNSLYAVTSRHWAGGKESPREIKTLTVYKKT